MVNGPIFNPREVVSIPVDGDTEKAISSEWAFEHAADFEAHIRSWFELHRIGVYNFFHLMNASAYTTVALVVDTMYAVPIVIARDMTFDRAAISVTIAGAGGTKARTGIYNNGIDLYPGTLVADYGEIAVDAAIIVEDTINQSLVKGLYWIVIITDGTPTVRGNDGAFSPLGVTNLVDSNGLWTVAQAYGALPDPFTPGGAIQFTVCPVIGLRVLSLD